MCGPAGSGKSTYARGLEARGYVRVSFDGEAWALGHRTHPIGDDARQVVNGTLQDKLVDCVKQGKGVVVDSSFWSRASRDEFRRLCAPSASSRSSTTWTPGGRSSWTGWPSARTPARTTSLCRASERSRTSTGSRRPHLKKAHSGSST
ncbi:AAA family ATPase [Microbacterium sp. NPDC059771]|uniref:AAA family ATPase n=1 Tax=Microbacterium sp. NPDC059771 TaxID=3346941 RepID=UPI003666F0E1